MALRTLLPIKDGTSMPPCSTSRTTVPLEGGFDGSETLLAAEDLTLDHPQIALSSVASWADDYRAANPDTGSWHFVDIPMDRVTYDPALDCKNSSCIVAAFCATTAG